LEYCLCCQRITEEERRQGLARTGEVEATEIAKIARGIEDKGTAGEVGG